MLFGLCYDDDDDDDDDNSIIIIIIVIVISVINLFTHWLNSPVAKIMMMTTAATVT
jgi:hypothetical protein